MDMRVIDASGSVFELRGNTVIETAGELLATRGVLQPEFFGPVNPGAPAIIRGRSEAGEPLVVVTGAIESLTPIETAGVSNTLDTVRIHANSLAE